jgi:hypothetical protein
MIDKRMKPWWSGIDREEPVPEKFCPQKSHRIWPGIESEFQISKIFHLCGYLNHCLLELPFPRVKYMA